MDALGEVTSASITGLVAECWPFEGGDHTLVKRPNFGSFVKVESVEQGLDIYAVVCDVITGPQDNLHKPAALRLTRAQLKTEQPHIFALLRTEISATTVGYSSGKSFLRRLPPQPPQVHDFVYPASMDEVRQLTSDPDFIRLIAGVSSVPVDELISACIREAYDAHKQNYQFLVQAGQSLTHLYREDYDRLTSILRKIQP